MWQTLARKVLGDPNDRALKPLYKTVRTVNGLEPQIQALDDAALKAKTEEFKQRYQQGEKLDELLPEAFAVVREAARRTLGQRHFDVQLIGGMVLHQGRIAEMKTGEGKTLVATLPVYLNALTGQGVQIVTVNDYLARRDADWMGQVYQFLGLKVGCIAADMADEERRQAYACDVTYATNNEVGFDYLRDNMKFRLEDMVQRGCGFAIVDEVDSILIDEARTPLIISGPADETSNLYQTVDALVPQLTEDDYELDEKNRSIALTEAGQEKAEQLLRQGGLIAEDASMYDIENVSLVHHVHQALRAHKLFTADKDYMVRDGKIVIIDEFTGRAMEGRRFGEGLHQALEAKEGVQVQQENQTLASVTFQNFFRLYPKLAGMTGTALTEAQEFGEIYGLEAVAIPTHEPVIRKDHDDEVYRTYEEKQAALLDELEAAYRRGQPVLVGTTSIEKSEDLSARMHKRGVPHNVLNARQHEQEAYVIAQAGRPHTVTIATNMAGRGTDIQLGGNVEMRIAQEASTITDPDERQARIDAIRAEVADENRRVIEAGGLYVVGTERHEARRIDNQLRGRSGRQGDPGASKFFLSLEDDLMRIFGSERMDSMLGKLGVEEGEAITHPWVNKALEKAQNKVEAQNFEVRKQLLRFDNVMNDQRQIVYEQRREIMGADDVSDTIADMRDEVVRQTVRKAIPKNAYPEQWDTNGLHEEILRITGLDLPVASWAEEEGVDEREVEERLQNATIERLGAKEAEFGSELMRAAEKSILLQVIDQTWKEHLLAMDHLRQGIGLRSYAQRNPLDEYKREAFEMFEQMLYRIREQALAILCNVEIRPPEAESGLGDVGEPAPQPVGGDTTRAPGSAAAAGAAGAAAATAEKDPASWGKVGRNQPCPCGSGKKYKHCHGKVA